MAARVVMAILPGSRDQGAMSQNPPREASKFQRWYALALLTGIFAANSIDRNVMAVVLEPVKGELQLSDAAMGTLVGAAHTVALALFVIPMGLLADRVNRVWLVSGLVIVWSALTSMGALANSYLSLLLMRAGVGAAEAGSPPASVALIADMFPAKQRPTALSTFYLAAAIGTGTIFLMGGYVAHHFGWRTVFIIAGIPGLLLGVLLLTTVRDPRPPIRSEARGLRGSGRDFKLLLANPALRWTCAGGTMATIGQVAVFAWMPSFLIRVHGYSLIDAGLATAAAAGLGKGLGTLFCGPLTRRAAGDRRDKLWRYPGGALAISVPLVWLMTSTASATTAVVLTFVLAMALGSWAGPNAAILIAGVERPRRGLATSVYHLSTNLIGGFGAMATGMISDRLGGGAAIGPALAITVSVNLLATGGLFMACRRLSMMPDEEEDA
jgi:predicted MFS family arabinose efflux permease